MSETERTLVGCKVWNDNIYDFRDTFKEKQIVVPAGKYIEMDPFEANDFVSKFYPIVKDAGGQPDPKSYKKLRKEWIYSDQIDQSPKAKEHVCNCCGYKTVNDAELQAHIKSRHADVEKPKKA